jgi:hypothetical protein
MMQRMGNMFAGSTLSSIVYVYIVAWLQAIMIGDIGNNISGAIILFLSPVDVVTAFIQIWMSIIFDGGTQIATWVKILFSIMIPFVVIDLVMSFVRGLIWLILSPFRLILIKFYSIRNKKNSNKKKNHSGNTAGTVHSHTAKSEYLNELLEEEQTLKKGLVQRDHDALKLQKEHVKMDKQRIKQQQRMLKQQKKEKKQQHRLQQPAHKDSTFCSDSPDDAPLSNRAFTAKKNDVIYINGKPRKIK